MINSIFHFTDLWLPIIAIVCCFAFLIGLVITVAFTIAHLNEEREHTHYLRKIDSKLSDILIELEDRSS